MNINYMNVYSHTDFLSHQVLAYSIANAGNDAIKHYTTYIHLYGSLIDIHLHTYLHTKSQCKNCINKTFQHN